MPCNPISPGAVERPVAGEAEATGARFHSTHVDGNMKLVALRRSGYTSHYQQLPGSERRFFLSNRDVLGLVQQPGEDLGPTSCSDFRADKVWLVGG